MIKTLITVFLGGGFAGVAFASCAAGNVIEAGLSGSISVVWLIVSLENLLGYRIEKLEEKLEEKSQIENTEKPSG